MKFQTLLASVRSFRILGVALPLAALLCAAPLTPAARAAAPSNPHIYIYDDLFGLTDVTDTYDGSSVVSLTGEVIYVNIVAVPTSGVGQHTTELTPCDNGVGQHTTEIVVDDTNSEIVGFVVP